MSHFVPVKGLYGDVTGATSVFNLNQAHIFYWDTLNPNAMHWPGENTLPCGCHLTPLSQMSDKHAYP